MRPDGNGGAAGRRAAAALRDLGASALLVVAESSRDPDLAPFVGTAHLGQSFVLLPAGGEPALGYFTPMEREEAAATGCRPLEPERLEVRRLVEQGSTPAELWTAVLERAFELLDLEPGRIVLAGRPALGHLHEACRRLEGRGWSFSSGHRLMLLTRKRKAPRELAWARQAAAGAVAAMWRVAELLGTAEWREGELRVGGQPLTAGRLREAVREVLAGFGLEQPEGSIVAAGAAAAVPHTQGDPAAVLRRGETVVVDLFPRGVLFADCTRTFCVGKPPPELAAAHEAVAAVLREAHQRAAGRATGWELQEAACERLAAAGYATPISHPGTETGYVHGLGHGVGYDLHEYPSFRRDAGEAGRLEDGDLFTLEPGLYDPGAGWGVRLEDLCHRSAGGVENLTPLPYDLDPRAWGDRPVVGQFEL